MPEVEAWVGSVLDGRYRLLEVARQGTTATTYRGTRLADGHPLVVKVLAARDPSDDELQRLRTEAAVGARIAHPGIATPIAVLRAPDGSPFVVYEQPAGEELAARLKRVGRMMVREVQTIVTELCDAVGAAHRAQVVHGDLRPGCLFLDGDGESTKVLVLDFGVARLRQAMREAPVAGTPALVGTPSYMAPEQAHGLAGDARSDQFSVAAMVYEMLMGKQPFGTGPAVAVLSRVLHAEPPPMVGVARDLERVVLRGLSKRPEERYHSLEVFASAFSDAAGRGAARPTVVPGRAPPHPWMTATKESVRAEEPAAIVVAPVPVHPRRKLLVAVAAGMTLIAALTVGVAVGRRWPVAGPPAAARPPAAAARPPETALIDIEVDPPESVVTVDGKPVNVPLVHVVRSSSPVKIVVEAPDHLPAARDIVPDRDQRLVIHLTSTSAPPELRNRAPTPRRPTAAPPPAGAKGDVNDLRDPFGSP